MRAFEIGVVLPLTQYGADRVTVRWSELRQLALHAEAIGFDTIWTPDELLWREDDGPPWGVWEGVAMAGAVAAVTLACEGRDVGHVRAPPQPRDHRQGG